MKRVGIRWEFEVVESGGEYWIRRKYQDTPARTSSMLGPLYREDVEALATCLVEAVRPDLMHSDGSLIHEV